MPLAQDSKLIFCLDEPRHTGAHLFILRLREFLSQQGCEVFIVSEVPYSVGNSYVTPKSPAGWKALLAEVQPDLGVGVFGRTTEFALALRGNGTARTWMCLVAAWLSSAEGKKARQANLLVYDNVLVPSHATALDLAPPLEVNVRCIGQGVDTELFQRCAKADVASLRTRLGIREDDFVLGYAGRFSADKNQLGLVAGLAGLARDEGIQGRRYQLILCGPPPTDLEREYAQQILQAARDLHIEQRVHIHFIEHAQLPLWYSCYDLMVSLSSVETFGLSTIESLACGTPLVGLEIPALCESLDFYRKQWLLPTPERVWEKVKQLSKQPGELQRVGTWAAQMVREKRDLRKSLHEHAHYFGELIGSTLSLARPTATGAIADEVGTRPTEPLA
jgi:glycosyltransferase involved in cell wall biosynthesis